jgi:RimJ/RimL family protein N-acetyltransferase
LHETRPLPHIETERLRLRAWRDSDREPWAAMNADPCVREFFPGLLSREESDASLDGLNGHIARHGYGFWALEERGRGEFLGFTGLLFNTTFPTRFTPGVEIGWRLARHAWGKGYATEAALASLDHGFGKLGLDAIVSFAVVANMRSRRVMERIGMRRVLDGDFDHPDIPAGDPLCRHVLYRITAAEHAEWNQSKSVEEPSSCQYRTLARGDDRPAHRLPQGLYRAGGISRPARADPRGRAVGERGRTAGAGL